MKLALSAALYFSALVAAPSSTLADIGLPDFQQDAVCPARVIKDAMATLPEKMPEQDRKVMTARCWEMQLQVKQVIERSPPPAPLLRYCVADAEFREDGYLGVLRCVDRERHIEQIKKVETTFLSSDFCSDLFPDGTSARGFEQCLDNEHQAKLAFHDWPLTMPDEALAKCTSDRGGSYSRFWRCARDWSTSAARFSHGSATVER